MRSSIVSSRLLAAAVIVATLANAHAAAPAKSDAPGGKGSLKPLLGEACIKSGSALVPEVCGRIQVNWKLWTLMGEPIGDFVLGWTPTSVRIANAEGGGTPSYSATNLPAALAKAVQRIEMYVDAVATVRNAPSSPNYTSVVLAFNTGVASKPGETSMNVPGGYNWDNFLQGRSSMKALGIGPQMWCVAEGRGQLNAADAKAVMRAGVQLDNLQLCPASTVDVSALENAIAKQCEASTGVLPRYCAKKPPPPKEVKAEPARNAIDDAFGALESRKSGAAAASAHASKKADAGDPMTAAFDAADAERSTRLQQQHDRDVAAARLAAKRKEVTEACTTAKAAQESCAAKNCGSKPDAQVCTDSRQDPLPPCNARPGHSCLFIPTYTCYGTGPNPKRAEWEACSANLVKGCASLGAPIASVEQCVSERMK